MKNKISVTVDESTLLKIFEALSRTKYKNRSELIEAALERLLEAD